MPRWSQKAHKTNYLVPTLHRKTLYVGIWDITGCPPVPLGSVHHVHPHARTNPKQLKMSCPIPPTISAWRVPARQLLEGIR